MRPLIKAPYKSPRRPFAKSRPSGGATPSWRGLNLRGQWTAEALHAGLNQRGHPRGHPPRGWRGDGIDWTHAFRCGARVCPGGLALRAPWFRAARVCLPLSRGAVSAMERRGCSRLTAYVCARRSIYPPSSRCADILYLSFTYL